MKRGLLKHLHWSQHSEDLLHRQRPKLQSQKLGASASESSGRITFAHSAAGTPAIRKRFTSPYRF